MLTDASNRQSLDPELQVTDLSVRIDIVNVSEYLQDHCLLKKKALKNFFIQICFHVKLSPNINKPKLPQFENSH